MPVIGGEQIAAGSAVALLEHALGFDEVAESALKRPAVEFQSGCLGGLFEIGTAETRFVMG